MEQPVPGEAPDSPITHGICNDCSTKISLEMGMPTRDYLDEIPLPVLVVNDEGRVLTANRQARLALGKELDQIENNTGGIVFECAHARLPGGCGKTEHCSGCTIRRSVMETFVSGKAIVRRTVSLNRCSPDGVRESRFLVSTEKAGEVVLLRIDEVGVEKH